MVSAPSAQAFQHRSQRHAVFRNRMVNARRHRAGVVAPNDPVVDQFVQVTNEHPLGDARNAAPQLGGPHRPVAQAPQDGALPAAIDHRQRGAIGQSLNSFFDTAIAAPSLGIMLTKLPVLRHGHRRGQPGRDRFWLTAPVRLSWLSIHRRPSVTEKSVEGPGASRRPPQEDEALTPAHAGVVHAPAASCAGAFVVSGGSQTTRRTTFTSRR